MTPQTPRRSRIAARDLLAEAIAGLLQRPGRAALTTLGAALGIATFVAVLGLSATAAGQIDARFTAIAASEVSLQRDALTPHDDPAFPTTAQEAVRALPGVVHVGITWTVPTQDTTATTPSTADTHREGLALQAVSPGYLDAIHARTSHGVPIDAFHETRAEHVAVLGSAAARRLGITRLDAQPAIWVGATALTVIGIIDTVDRAPDTLLSVLVPTSTATAIWGPGPTPGAATTMLIETRLGAAQQIGRQAKIAARPESPERTRAIVPPDPRALRDGIGDDLDALSLGLAAIVLLVGAVGIANTSLVAVLERVPEIGLRRALGARRRHIAAQFLAESGALGGLGGLIGTTIGILAVTAVTAVAAAHHWTPIIAPMTVYPAPAAGALTGLLAGLYPAWRATRIEPSTALRGS